MAHFPIVQLPGLSKQSGSHVQNFNSSVAPTPVYSRALGMFLTCLDMSTFLENVESAFFVLFPPGPFAIAQKKTFPGGDAQIQTFLPEPFSPKRYGRDVCVCWPDTGPILFRFPLLRGYRFSDSRQLPPPNGAPKMEDQVKSLIWQILLNCTQLTFHMNYRFGQKETKEKKYNHWIIGESCSPFGSRSSPPPPPTSVPPKAERRRRRR